MGNASQAHKLNTRGYDSLGGRKGLVYDKSNSGTNSVPVTLVIEGLWSATDTLTVTTDIGAGNVASNYSPSVNEDAETMAEGIRAAINLQTDHTAVRRANEVDITKTTAGTVTLVSFVVS